ncbi:hypothetical protein HBB16_03365 [Pseudonocardia sp. MCCB 268]|nr:hypothetical protein [Pseudonocardia cytotoxica]
MTMPTGAPEPTLRRPRVRTLLNRADAAGAIVASHAWSTTARLARYYVAPGSALHSTQVRPEKCALRDRRSARSRPHAEADRAGRAATPVSGDAAFGMHAPAPTRGGIVQIDDAPAPVTTRSRRAQGAASLIDRAGAGELRCRRARGRNVLIDSSGRSGRTLQPLRAGPC